jgi:hypothetical protein
MQQLQFHSSMTPLGLFTGKIMWPFNQNLDSGCLSASSVALTKGKSSKKIIFEEVDNLSGCRFAWSLDVFHGVLKRFKKPIAFL